MATRLAQYSGAVHRHTSRGELRRPHRLYDSYRGPPVPACLRSLGYDTMAAASNMPTPEQIHEMLDRYRASASPFSGSSLLAARYRDVYRCCCRARGPSATLACRFPSADASPSSGSNCRCRRTRRLSPACAMAIGALHLRIEQIAPSETEAAALLLRSAILIQLIQANSAHRCRGRPISPKPEALSQFTSSLKIEQHKDRAVLTASLPLELLKKLVTPMKGGSESFSGETNPPGATSP